MASKLKKYSKNFLCMLSAGMFFIMAVFYPLEDFMANEIVSPDYLYANIVEYTWNYAFTDLYAEDSQFAVRPTQVDLGNYADADQYTYFYWGGASCPIYNMQGKYYAYRIEVEALDIVKDSGSQIFNKVFLISEASDLLDFNGSVAFTTNQVYWYVSEFADAVPLFITPVWILYEYYAEDSAFSYFNGASVDYNATYRFTVVPYSVQDLTDEIYWTLNDIYATNQSMLTKLEQIYTSVDTVETKLQSLVNIAQQIEDNTDELEGLLKTCNSYLASIQSELEEQTTWLEKIYAAIVEFLGIEGEDSVESMPDDDMNNMLNIENELLGDASSDDLANDLTVTIDNNSSGFIWDIINRLITSNSVLFGGVVSILSLGIVALILGR